MKTLRGDGRSTERGYSLVALVASATIMLILLAAAVPSWRYVMKNDREEELIFRGGQIADAVARFQKRNGNALPPSLEVLVRGKYLRKEFKDPMAKDGKWRFIRQGEMIGPITPPGSSPRPSPSPGPGVPTGQPLGGIMGVASTSKEKSLRIFNGRDRYSEWTFIAGQPRIVGASPGPGLPPRPGLPPGVGPSPPPQPPRPSPLAPPKL